MKVFKECNLNLIESTEDKYNVKEQKNVSLQQNITASHTEREKGEQNQFHKTDN
jgi:hypothetical protein